MMGTGRVMWRTHNKFMIDVFSATTAQKQPKRNFNLLHQQMKHTAQFPDAVTAYKLKTKQNRKQPNTRCVQLRLMILLRKEKWFQEDRQTWLVDDSFANFHSKKQSNTCFELEKNSIIQWKSSHLAAVGVCSRLWAPRHPCVCTAWLLVCHPSRSGGRRFPSA